jgi:hypothetical protein
MGADLLIQYFCTDELADLKKARQRMLDTVLNQVSRC